MIDFEAGKQVSFKLATASWLNCKTDYVKVDTALIYLPSDYYTSGKYYPVIMFCHGYGERGTDINKVRGQGLPKVIEQKGAIYGKDKDGNRIDFIVISIQNETWSPSPSQNYIGLNCLIGQGLRVDKSRIYVTGLSAGGQNSHGTIETYPDTFAACVSMSPASEVTDDKVSAYKDRYIWFIQGTSDTTVSPSFAYNSVDKINKAYPGHARLTKFAGGHCCWPTYYNPEWRDTDGLSIYDWMLQYSISDATQPIPPTTEEPPITDPPVTDPVDPPVETDPPKEQKQSVNGIIVDGEKTGTGVVTLELPNNSITLDGSQSEGEDLIYSWGILHGRTFPEKGDHCTITGLTEGTYTIYLTVNATNAYWPTGDKITIVVKPSAKVIREIDVNYQDGTKETYTDVQRIQMTMKDGSTKLL